MPAPWAFVFIGMTVGVALNAKDAPNEVDATVQLAQEAADAGLRGVWVDRPGGRRTPVADHEIEAADVLVIHSLAELPAALGL